MPLSRLTKFFGWPVIAGLLLGTCIILWLNSNGAGSDNTTDRNFHIGTLTPSSNGWGGPVSYSEAVNSAAPAVVNIYTRTKLKRRRHPLLDDPLFRHFFNNSDLPQQERMQSALGSGVIISPEGYLLTNNHVIEGADEILVLLQDGREAQATLVGTDPESDLAVLKIPLTDLTSIKVGDPANAQIGDVVLAIGNPFGVGQTVTQGIISATGRYGLGINTYENYIQTDAAINPGNSGGALIDAHGNLLGINTAILDKTGFSVGIGFAIPADTAVKVMRDLVSYGQVVRGWLGIEAQQMTPELAQSFKLNAPTGVIITAIYNNSPAFKAGLQPGDIILRMNNVTVSDGRLSMMQVAQGRPGDKIEIEVLRNGEKVTVNGVLGVKPPTNNG
ncbi:trypsin-like peptidase domain-containing protein [Aestuariicella sp. G3-2]|uniref:trypsin-like peptidase domain-containing protein n=1 Tax=Pseudomaricurvus albidus TaxID=2842452 RepID=UPI001C0C0DDC|nr:trypsin-like peptidase domain-containing protein [Aestuariicella albida]MBU3069721.1 trypsin-like peptidase domain-containing protein [Aestuariicella albida]